MGRQKRTERIPRSQVAKFELGGYKAFVEPAAVFNGDLVGEMARLLCSGHVLDRPISWLFRPPRKGERIETENFS
ncbi:hypothetical protein VTI28DRAFT_10330 [Corynascus sepedonium]